MRYFLLVLIVAGLAASASAQIRITGRITDEAGKSIEYVNIGIPGTTVGVVSDGAGRFSILVPDSLAGRELLFSHISYGSRSVPVADLAGGGDDVIRLPRGVHTIPEVVIRPGRTRRLGPGGMRMPMPSGSTFLMITSKAGENPDRLPELGTVLRVRRPMAIEEVSLPVHSCTDSLLLRVNLYQIERVAGDTLFTPLHNIPFYVLFVPADEKYIYTVDVSEGAVVAREGEILVSLEQVAAYAQDITLGMPFYFGASYTRDSFHDPFSKEDIPVHIGFEVSGRERAE